MVIMNIKVIMNINDILTDKIDKGSMRVLLGGATTLRKSSELLLVL